MKMDMRTVHYVQLALGAAAGSGAVLMSGFPATDAPFIKAGIATCAFLAAVLGVLSPSVSPSVNAAANARYLAKTAPPKEKTDAEPSA